MKTLIKKLISPSIRYELNQTAAWFRQQLDLACLWRWEMSTFSQQGARAFDIIYVGRKKHLTLAKILLGGYRVANIPRTNILHPGHTAFVTEIPLPGALCVPQYLRAIVPLGRPIEEIMATYDDKLRRTLLKQRPRVHLRHTHNEAEIEYADREMLQPYAQARHGSAANLMPSEMVRKFALQFGRLDLVLSGDEVVACMLGAESIRAGKRYWVADRCGYPDTVFSDPKRLSDINSINHHLAIETAIQYGYDYCDFALCFARPDDGLLQFKRSRGAVIDTIGLKGHGYFYIRLPKVGAAQFLWDAPLFTLERKQLALHLGLPEDQCDDDVVARYRRMGFGGLFKIYLHATTAPSKELLASLSSLYKLQNPAPIFQYIPSS